MSNYKQIAIVRGVSIANFNETEFMREHRLAEAAPLMLEALKEALAAVPCDKWPETYDAIHTAITAAEWK
jgi:hypothetical protein